MKLTECLQYINQALNFPSITYNDVSLYFEMAMAELNTTLHTSIPRVSEMIETFKQYLSKDTANKIRLTDDPASTQYVIPTEPVGKYYYDATQRIFKVKDSTESWISVKYLKGLYIRNGMPELYISTVYGNTASWVLADANNILECDLKWYFPDEWILLWVIPYVCFKYTVRDGGSASTFAEELTQGFQQLQDTYDVPEKVILATVADKQAYTEDVTDNLPNLNILVPTKAIYESMKHNRSLNAIYGSMFDRGGFND